MSFSINPSQTKTLTIVFTDNASPPVQHPLSDVPTCVDTTGVATVTPVGTQTASNPSYSWSIACPASAVLGSALSVDVKGLNPDGVVDEETYTITVAALDDTQQQATFS